MSEIKYRVMFDQVKSKYFLTGWNDKNIDNQYWCYIDQEGKFGQANKFFETSESAEAFALELRRLAAQRVPKFIKDI